MLVRSESRRPLAFPCLTAALAALAVSAVFGTGSQQAADLRIVGSWRQSAWKLCKPVAQITASDVDPPIERLEFGPDGTFSVTWPGGGAHSLGVPHEFIPDYRGRYTLDAKAGRIRMENVRGLFVPNDFAGSGSYAISGNALTLTGVWFGTRRAKQKPDICELTFTKN
jgi:hypothetical protein